MPTRNRLTRRDLLTLFLVLVVAAILRLGTPDVTEFFHDEAILSMLALDMARGEAFPLRGIVSSVGIPNPPTSVYVMAIPYLFTDNPLWATLFVAALNVAGVGVLWLLARRYFSRNVALIAGLAYAVSPWAVMYSRKIWAQDFHTPFFLLAMLLGIYGFVEGRRWAQIACLPVLLFALQIHFAAWALLPLYLVLVWMGRDKTERRTLILSAIFGALVMLPYGIGLTQSLTEDPTRITTAVDRTGASDGLTLSGDSLSFALRLITGEGLEVWLAPNETVGFPFAPSLWVIVAGVVVFGVAVLWVRYRTFAPLVTLWAVLPVVVFALTWTRFYPHYLIASIPAWMLLAGIGLEGFIVGASRLAQPENPRAASLPRLVILAGFIALLASQALWWQATLRFLDTTEITLGAGTSGFTTPVGYLLPVRDAVRAYEDVVIVSDGMWTDFDVEAARWVVMLRDSARCVRTLPGDGIAVIPAGRFAAVTAPNAPPHAANGLYRQTSALESVSVFPTRDERRAYIVTRYESAPEWTDSEFTDVSPVTFANGVQLTGYARTASRVYLRWTLPDASATDYQYFVHLIGGEGEMLAQGDASFWAGRHWCAGDTLITWQPLTADGAQTLRTGFYTLGRTPGEYVPVDVLDVMGNPAGNWVDVALP